MNELPDNAPQDFDVIVIGAGPGGCEAALAAAHSGAAALCLTINLDTVGFPPANPIIAEDADDPRLELLEEISALGGALPHLLSRETVARTLAGGTLVADRRNLGLAYKELLEETNNVFPRQTLVTDLERTNTSWKIQTRLGELFKAPAVIIAAGTFLEGKVDDGGTIIDGGRMGEIPANALARSLEAQGIGMSRLKAANMPRLDRKTLPGDEEVFAVNDYRLLPDGSQLDESYMFGPYITGTREEQLVTVAGITGTDDAWMTRAAYSVTSLALDGNQVDSRLEARAQPGLFFVGRAAGCCNYTEAAATGLVAGSQAAAAALKQERGKLTNDMILVSRLCEAVAHQESRPVTIRIDGPGC